MRRIIIRYGRVIIVQSDQDTIAACTAVINAIESIAEGKTLFYWQVSAINYVKQEHKDNGNEI